MNLEHIDIALRTYVPSETWKHATQEIYIQERPVLVLDTETTEDEYQNLLFGTCGIWTAGYLHKFILFHAQNLAQKDIDTLRTYAESQKVNNVSVEVIAVNEFISKVFFPWLLKNQALCIGFNLPFDLSRRKPDHITRPNFLDRASLALRQIAANCHDQCLA